MLSYNRKTAIAIDTIINQKRFNDGANESRFLRHFFPKKCIFGGYHAIPMLMLYKLYFVFIIRGEIILRICCHWPKKKYSSSNYEAIRKCR